MVNVTGGKTPDFGSRTYTEIMREQMLKGEEAEVNNFPSNPPLAHNF